MIHDKLSNVMIGKEYTSSFKTACLCLATLGLTISCTASQSVAPSNRTASVISTSSTLTPNTRITNRTIKTNAYDPIAAHMRARAAVDPSGRRNNPYALGRQGRPPEPRQYAAQTSNVSITPSRKPTNDQVIITKIESVPTIEIAAQETIVLPTVQPIIISTMPRPKPKPVRYSNITPKQQKTYNAPYAEGIPIPKEKPVL